MNELFEIQERIGRIEYLIARLIETNQDIPVIVEGEQDVRTLRKLGLQGTILKVHTGETLYDPSDGLGRQGATNPHTTGSGLGSRLDAL